MPYKIKSTGKGRVKVTSPHGVKAKSATPENARKQVRLLNAVEHNPEFREKLKNRVMKRY
jgi:hypothetical protein